MIPKLTLDSNAYFYELKHLCEIVPLLLQYAEGVDNWFGKDWHTFLTHEPSKENTLKFCIDPVIDYFVHTQWNLNFTCMPPKSYYSWHTDINGNRQTAINLVLNNHKESKAIWKSNNIYRKMITEILDLNYKPNVFYVFNTQEEHCVFNFADSNRYMLTLTPNLRFAVPEYFEGKYKISTYLRYKEINEQYKLAFNQIVYEVKDHGW